MSSSFSPRLNKYEKARWLKVFFHNATGGFFFQSASEALFSSSEQKYSILELLHEGFRCDNHFVSP
jgi:hypothetical protein